MRPSYARAHVLELLERHGPLTKRELVSLELTLSINALNPLMLKWLKGELVSRWRAADCVHLTHRYAITPKGRAVLATDRIDREAVEFARVGSLKTLEVAGRRLTIAEAAAELGLKPKTLRARLDRGMSPEDALRPQRAARRVPVDGHDRALAEVAAQAQVSYDTVRRRLAEGKAPDQVAAPAYYRGACSREAIRALLATAAAPMTRLEIARALGFHEDAARVHLDRMRRDGELQIGRRSAQGHALLYSLAAAYAAD